MATSSTEAQHPDAAGIHLAAPQVVLERLLASQISALQAVGNTFAALDQVAGMAAAALQSGHRVIYAGAGSSGLMALADCLELAGTFGIPPNQTPMMLAGGTATLLHMTGAPEDDPHLAANDLRQVDPAQGDVLIAVSASGSTPYTVAVAKGAKSRGAFVVGMANVEDAELLRLADVAVLIETGAEVIAGSTRMGAASAQKAALNLISVLMAIRLGHVHDGMMVNLLADNAKLEGRAAGIVAAVAGTGPEMAIDALRHTSGAVKPAILVAKGATTKEAAALLAQSEGHLAVALAAFDDKTNRATSAQ
jgi:N-acetylmuramic acid 6-phosphate etherase